MVKEISILLHLQQKTNLLFEIKTFLTLSTLKMKLEDHRQSKYFAVYGC